MKKNWLTIVFLLCFSVIAVADDNDYQTIRTFMSAQMYGEAYNELMKRELAGLKLDSKLRSLKIDLLDRTNAKLQKQAKTNQDDPGIYIVLADIAFQKGDYDRASTYISTAISNNGSVLANYTFAKILFRKGNISAAFDQMSKVLEAMPESPIVFNDFQFLYNCKQYGVTTARKLTKDCSFLERATPIAYDDDEIAVPESPFDNDPTETSDAPDFSNYNTVSKSKSKKTEDYDLPDSDLNIDDDLDELSQIDISLKNDKEKSIQTASVSDKTKKQNESLFPDEESDEDSDEESDSSSNSNSEIDSNDFDFEIDSKPEKKVEIKKEDNNKKPSEDSETKEKEEDPEMAKLKQAEELLESAKIKFNSGNIDNAETNLKELNKLYPNLPGKQELEDKIKYERNIRNRYKEALTYYDSEEFSKALGIFKEAYNHNPKLYSEAPFYIGRCYLLKEDPDEEQALKYFSFIEDDPALNPEIKRDILWTKLEIYYGQEKYEEADELYQYFVKNESDFLKLHDEHYRYKLWWNLYKTWIILVFSIFLAITIIVFILQFAPDLAKIGGDPVANAQKALDSGNFDKAIKIGEKALVKKQPIQLDRQLREILVQAYFNKANYEKCQFHAKTILKSFPENNIAWGHLAKASIEIQDSSHEAVGMYEKLYQSDPSRKELLPMLAKFYAANKDQSPAAMEILLDYHNINPEDTDVIIALAEGYVKNRTMTEEIIPILNDAIKLKDKLEYRELLARTFSKCGLYEEAARECVTVLNRNINNIGIHVVYTSSMKKLKQIPRAIAQYKEFIQSYPTNNQLIEILDGLKKEDMDNSTPADEVVSIFDSLGMPGMDNEEQPQAPISETDNINSSSTPIPDFLGGSSKKNTVSNQANNASDNHELPDNIQTLDPFAENDSLFDGFDTEELPEELGGTGRPPVSSSKSLDNLVDGFNQQFPDNLSDVKVAPPPNKSNNSESSGNHISLELQQKIDDAKDLATFKKWDRIIEILSPEFASDRNKEVGMLLVDAWLGNNKPEMALEIIQTLDFDPEMMSEEVKDVMYRTAVALEMNKNYSSALKLYDTICNADINYRDAFDKSDRLYVKMKG